jgi:hypothetical protein
MFLFFSVIVIDDEKTIARAHLIVTEKMKEKQKNFRAWRTLPKARQAKNPQKIVKEKMQKKLSSLKELQESGTPFSATLLFKQAGTVPAYLARAVPT